MSSRAPTAEQIKKEFLAEHDRVAVEVFMKKEEFEEFVECQKLLIEAGQNPSQDTAAALWSARVNLQWLALGMLCSAAAHMRDQGEA